MIIIVPDGLVERLSSLKRRVRARLGDTCGDDPSRFTEIAVLTRGIDSLERDFPAEKPALAADVQPGKLGGASR